MLLVSQKGAAFEARKLPARDVLCLLVNPDKGRQLLIGSRSSGVWYSGVDGSSWIDLGLQGVEVRSLAVDWKAGRIWAASSNLMFKRGIYTRTLKKAW